jgi:hypothetical protein
VTGPAGRRCERPTPRRDVHPQRRRRIRAVGLVTGTHVGGLAQRELPQQQGDPEAEEGGGGGHEERRGDGLRQRGDHRPGHLVRQGTDRLGAVGHRVHIQAGTGLDRQAIGDLTVEA